MSKSKISSYISRSLIVDNDLEMQIQICLATSRRTKLRRRMVLMKLRCCGSFMAFSPIQLLQSSLFRLAMSTSKTESTHLDDTKGVQGSPPSTLYWGKTYAANKTRQISKTNQSSQKATAGFEPEGAWFGIVSLTSAAAPRLFQKGARSECPTAIRRHNLCTHTRSLAPT
jgi:hypothetical protein